MDKSSPQNHEEHRPLHHHAQGDRRVRDRGRARRTFLGQLLLAEAVVPQVRVGRGRHRELRAVEAFNAGTQAGKDMKVLRPTLLSACPHVLANIVPRQMVEMGDPLRRGCDQSEAIGANM